ncbi:MAG TPA: crossover junction endodeoxyribonuclease RuvC [Candidatus Dormibacteraeota bacterium]|nr:crossover junction endodeoxyribonuclease RuvC [Candidatus Dormibacteraeota bacterium]
MNPATQPKSCLRVLGVDPAASGPTGYAVLEGDERMAHTLLFGELRHPSRAPFGERLCELHRRMAHLLREYSPDAVALETVFAAPNIRTSLKLAEARGVVLLAAAQAGVAVHSYTPREVKFQVTGYGAASKTQIQTMVCALLKLAEPPGSHDASDALALALCHIFTDRARRRVREAGDRLYPARIEA